jgi:hypothetical protein
MATFSTTETALAVEKEVPEEPVVGATDNPSTGSEEDAEKRPVKESEDDFAPEYVSVVTAFVILTPVILVYFLQMLDASVIATAIPSITTQFNSLLDVGWYVETICLLI